MLSKITIEELEYQIERINNTFSGENKRSFSIIDKDLLLSQIRELYEKVKQLEIVDIIETKFIQVEELNMEEKVQKENEIANQLIKEENFIHPQNVNIENKKENEVHKIEQIQPTFDDLVNKVKEQMIHQSKPLDIEPVLENSKVEIPVNFSDFNLDDIFNVNLANELSDKLSQSHIDDIGKSMGLNERIFTLNELFDGNNREFENSLQELNNAISFEQAKEIISKTLAIKYNWTTESKIKKAKDFIKLVKRRFV